MAEFTKGAHTPEPWSLEDDDIYSVYPSSELLASVYPMKRDKLFESWKANGRLIAAAPELLAVLEELIAYQIEQLSPHRFGCDECGETARTRAEIPHREFCRIGKAEAAIRKAKGVNHG